MLQMLQRYTVRKLRHGYQFAAVKFGVPANQVNCGSPLTHKTIVAVRRAILKVKKGWNILVWTKSISQSHKLFQEYICLVEYDSDNYCFR
jgi:hypothetical protein